MVVEVPVLPRRKDEIHAFRLCTNNLIGYYKLFAYSESSGNQFATGKNVCLWNSDLC